MRLNQIAITNHSRIRDCNFAVREHLVIVGANNVGKTSLLRCLNLLLGASVQQLYQGLSVDDLADHTQPMTVRAVLEGFGDEDRAQFPDEISVTPEGAESLALELRVEVDPDDPEQIAIRRSFPDGNDRTPSRDQLDALGWRYLSASRSSGVDALEGRRGPLRSMLRDVDLGENQAALVSALDGFNDLLSSNEALGELRQRIAEHLSRSMPQTVSADELALRTNGDPGSDVLEEVQLFLRDGETTTPLTEQSDGVRQLMGMTFFDLAQHSAHIVAVDEPELHLHASSQRTVAELFAHSQNQRVLVTHSPYVVQRFEPAHVLVVTADRTTRQIAAGRLSRVEKEMANWWAPNLLEALTARHVLLVEGIADRVLVEAAARAMDLNLDRLGVSILVLDGADKFSHVNTLLGRDGFQLHLLGLVDYAERGSWLGGLQIRPQEVNSDTLFVASPDLEGEYATGMTATTLAHALIAEGVCRTDGLLQATRSASVHEIEAATIAEFCRSRKISAALAAGSHLTTEHVHRMPALGPLMRTLAAL